MVFANIVAWLDVTPDWLFLYLKREKSEWCEDPNLNLTKVHVTELSTANGQNWFRSSNPTNKLNQFHVILRILHYFLYLLSLSWEMFRCIVGVKNLPKKSLRRYHGNFLKIVVTCWKNSWSASLPPETNKEQRLWLSTKYFSYRNLIKSKVLLYSRRKDFIKHANRLYLAGSWSLSITVCQPQITHSPLLSESIGKCLLQSLFHI